MSTIDATPWLVLLSYDVTKGNRSAASRVAHLIFGRADVRRDEVRPFIRRAGVIWIGQSVFVLPQPDAHELAEKLRGLGAIVTTAPIAVDTIRFEDFRRRALRRRPA
jgi:CRISPR/Cas system-associated endoribonuclease Cas2